MSFDSKSGAFGCASIMSVVVLIGAGLMLLGNSGKDPEAWALYLIACGAGGFIGFMAFGRKCESAKAPPKSAEKEPESSQDEGS